MKVNWKVRLKNGPWLAAFVSAIVSFIFTLLGMLGVAPEFSQDRVMQLINMALMILSTIGVITDPTQAALLQDSNRAMGYEEPWHDIPNFPDAEMDELTK